MARRKHRTPEEQLVDLEEELEALREVVRERKKFSPAAVRKDRERLGLSGAQYAKLVDVAMITIYSWEHGRTKPRADQLKRWLAVTKMSPDEAWEELGIEDMVEATGFSPDAVYAERERLELSAADYAELVGVAMLTIYNWEKGKTVPRDAQLKRWKAVKGIGKRKAWKQLGIV